MSNKGSYRKVSNLERLMNRDIILFAALLLILCISTAVASIQIKVDDGFSIWYIDSDELVGSSSAVEGIFIFLTMMILFQILIPVSLYVSLELVKLVQVQFIHWDRDIWSDEYNQGVECRSLNITEDLGCIEHVFCDKTGTLTENSMIFREFSINGTSFPHHSHREMIKQASKSSGKGVGGISSPYPLGKTVSALSNDLENGNPSQVPPRKTHHRRVQSDLASTGVQLGDISRNDFILSISHIRHFIWLRGTKDFLDYCESLKILILAMILKLKLSQIQLQKPRLQNSISTQNNLKSMTFYYV